MGKVKEYYREQLKNRGYEEDPSIEYHMIYAGRYGKWIPKIYNWFNKLFASPKKIKPTYVKGKDMEIPF